MAKKSTVFYQLPIEEMRGKLATKQKDLVYSGQKAGENTLALGTGKHEAINFVKYFVLTKRRGKNFFYAKSATSIRNTTATNFQRASMALSASIADYIRPYVLDNLAYTDVRAAFDYWSEGKTMREWLVSLILEAIATRQEYVSCLSAPNAQGISSELNIIANPVFSFDTLAEDIKPTAFAAPLFTDDNKNCAILQEYFRYYAGILDCLRKKITVEANGTGRKYQIELLYQEGTPSNTFQALQNTVQGASYKVLFSTSTPAVLGRVSVFGKGGRLLASGDAYADEARTASITAESIIPNTDFIYLGDR